MGAATSKDDLPETCITKLDISQSPNSEEFIKHSTGECLQGSLLELPWEMYYNTVSLYKDVDASFNFISSIPDELSLHVPHLKYLDLSHNQLITLPPSFKLLFHLKELYLSNNRIKNFPTIALCSLAYLKVLDVSHNMLSELPKSDCWLGMKSLEKLNVSDNRLQALPNTLSLAPKLSVVVVRGNDIIHPPPNVCLMGSEKILAYLRDHTPTRTSSSPGSPIFKRIRGDHVSASVGNPESALRQYQQGSYTGPGNKRKCPMMPPKDSTTLSPHELTQTLKGLIFGCVSAEAVGLSCEGLSASEVSFFYRSDRLSQCQRVKDKLRSHYAKNDWGPNADLMLVSLESILRWGGVVDELEWAALIHQWMAQGLSDVDDRPGHPLSPLLTAVFSSPGYSVCPYTSAEKVSAGVGKCGKEERTTVDSFTVGGGPTESPENPSTEHPMNPEDNSCLPAALVMGLPSFSQLSEVQSNADRICRASHSSPVARMVSVFTASLVASILQGKWQRVTVEEADDILTDTLNSSVAECNLSPEEGSHISKLWTSSSDEVLSLKTSSEYILNLKSCHVLRSLLYVKHVMISYVQETSPTVEPRRQPLSSTSSEGATLRAPPPESIMRLMSDSALVGGYSDQGVKTPKPDIFRRLVSEVCHKGGWGVCAHACVMGGILGALGGYDSLSQEWLKDLPSTNKVYINNKVNLLLDMFGLP